MLNYHIDISSLFIYGPDAVAERQCFMKFYEFYEYSKLLHQTCYTDFDTVCIPLFIITLSTLDCVMVLSSKYKLQIAYVSSTH